MSSQRSENLSLNINDESSMENEIVVNSRYNTHKLIFYRFHDCWFMHTFTNNSNIFLNSLFMSRNKQRNRVCLRVLYNYTVWM